MHGRGIDHARDDDQGNLAHRAVHLLRANNVTQFCYVPDAGHKVLIDRSLADPDVHSVPLTTEEEGVAWSPAPTSVASARCC